jgi:hypothetical protein
MHLPQVGILTSCKCGHVVLVEQVLVGSNHTISTSVFCWACLTPEQQEAAKIKYNLRET